MGIIVAFEAKTEIPDNAVGREVEMEIADRSSNGLEPSEAVQLLPENPWGYAKRLRFFVDTISRHFSVRNIRILDVGCGNGSQVGIPLAKLGYTVVGIDPHVASIENARRDAPATATFRCGYLSELAERNFQVVILSEVLEHLHDPDKLLAEAREYVSPDGVVIVTVPNGIGEFEIDWFVFSKLKVERVIERFRRHTDSGSASSENQDGHVQFYRIPRLKRMFTQSGLTIVGTGRASFACGPFAAYAFNHLPGWVLKMNSKITDYLPMRLASGWYFVLRPTVSRPPS